jgi:hypothetical protein
MSTFFASIRGPRPAQVRCPTNLVGYTALWCAKHKAWTTATLTVPTGADVGHVIAPALRPYSHLVDRCTVTKIEHADGSACTEGTDHLSRVFTVGIYKYVGMSAVNQSGIPIWSDRALVKLPASKPAIAKPPVPVAPKSAVPVAPKPAVPVAPAHGRSPSQALREQQANATKAPKKRSKRPMSRKAQAEDHPMPRRANNMRAVPDVEFKGIVENFFNAPKKHQRTRDDNL